MEDVKKDETIEDITDIEVELPNEDEAVEESTPKSEETVKEEAAPETQESAETEETEEDTETSPDLEADDEQEDKPQSKTYGKRAEKRIKRLIKQKKELEEALAKAEGERQALTKNNETLDKFIYKMGKSSIPISKNKYRLPFPDTSNFGKKVRFKLHRIGILDSLILSQISTGIS